MKNVAPLCTIMCVFACSSPSSDRGYVQQSASKDVGSSVGLAESVKDSIRTVVQKAYDEYVAIESAHGTVPPWSEFASSHMDVLSANLAAELKADGEAKLKSPGELVGIDFDPLLGGQDPCDHYRVTSVLDTAGSYVANIEGDCAPPLLIKAVIVRQEGMLRISDVVYASGKHLLAYFTKKK